MAFCFMLLFIKFKQCCWLNWSLASIVFFFFKRRDNVYSIYRKRSVQILL